MAKLIKKLLLSTAVGATSIFLIGVKLNATTESIIYGNQNPIEHVQLRQWINILVQQESSGRTNIKILDNNHKYSYGCLQFQKQTFVGYAKSLNMLPETEDNEIENFIYDCEYAKLLVEKMIENNYDNWKHWKNSVDKIGMPPR